MRLRLVLCALLFAGFARPAHADLWMGQFSGNLPMGDGNGGILYYEAYSGLFMYDDMGMSFCHPNCSEPFWTPMLYLSVTVAGHEFSLEQGVVQGLGGNVITPSGPSNLPYHGIVQPVFGSAWGPFWTLAPEYLPTGWRHLSVGGGGLFFALDDGIGRGVQQPFIFGSGSLGPKPANIPEPTSLMAGLGALGAVLTLRQVRRKQDQRARWR